MNVNPAYRTHEYTYVINQSGLTWLFATTSFKTTDYREMIDRTRSDCPCLARAGGVRGYRRLAGPRRLGHLVADGRRSPSD